MPFDIQLTQRPAGYAAENATPGHQVKVVTREFTSSEDGNLFVSRLEGLPADILSLLPPENRILPSMVDHLIAVIRPDLTGKVFVNECPIMVGAKAARRIEAGELVLEDDIVDIHTLSFEGVDIPPNAAIICVFSHGWRKALFFDVGPLYADDQPRNYDVRKVLGSFYAYLHNQSIFSLDELGWGRLLAEGWFPFVSLTKRRVRQMVDAVRAGMTIEHQVPEIVLSVKELIPNLREQWANSDLFRPHLHLLETALARFEADDYVSATAILYPRIEGLLRSIHDSLDRGTRRKQKDLSRSAVSQIEEQCHPHSWLLPEKFQKFLDDVYFAGFSTRKCRAIIAEHGRARRCGVRRLQREGSLRWHLDSCSAPILSARRCGADS